MKREAKGFGKQERTSYLQDAGILVCEMCVTQPG